MNIFCYWTESEDNFKTRCLLSFLLKLLRRVLATESVEFGLEPAEESEEVAASNALRQLRWMQVDTVEQRTEEERQQSARKRNHVERHACTYPSAPTSTHHQDGSSYSCLVPEEQRVERRYRSFLTRVVSHQERRQYRPEAVHIATL